MLTPLRLRDGLVIETPSHVAWIDGIEQLLLRTATDAGLDTDGAHYLGVAAREALVNAIQHGHGFDVRRKVKVGIRIASGRVIVMTVRDQGPGFDPSRVPDPVAPENLTKPDGRGLLFMRAFADRVSFAFPRSGGALVRLEKDLPGQKAA